MDAEFPILLHATRLHLGALLAAMAAIFIWWLMRFTTLGFAIRAVGENPRAANYAGHNITKVIILTAMISGGLAGLAGVGEAAGLEQSASLIGNRLFPLIAGGSDKIYS